MEFRITPFLRPAMIKYLVVFENMHNTLKIIKGCVCKHFILLIYKLLLMNRFPEICFSIKITIHIKSF